MQKVVLLRLYYLVFIVQDRHVSDRVILNVQQKKSVIMNLLRTLFLIACSNVVWADPLSKISADSIGIDVELIGESGLPLGTVFSVEGMISVEKGSHHKEGDNKFVIIRKLNGESLKEVKKMRLWGDFKVDEGKWMKMMVIEDATYSLVFTPNHSVGDIGEEKGRQTIYTGLRIIKAE